ncbi:hypothetical protein [Pedobacter heparinus]|uniref:hypothetical protein n=1 Tax=Pedobacter heparinus TaxID=984 RepID=UPI00292D668E|nr:hypothetical protein [Pedobacter heparinus]
MISILKAGAGDLNTLQEISKTTFFETFRESNTEEDMRQYLAVNFSLNKLTAELDEVINVDSKPHFKTP